MGEAFFSIVEPPADRETAVVVEIPHAGTFVPPAYMRLLSAPIRAIGEDADLYVDRLYEGAEATGASMLVAHVSRYVLDLNRREEDIDHECVEGAPDRIRLAHGLVWKRTTRGEPVLTRPLRPAELQERLEALYRPYHTALAKLVHQKLANFGHAIVLAAHSMPSGAPPNAGHERGMPRADIVPGTQGQTTADRKIITAVEAQAATMGWNLRHDTPYRGGFTTQFYGRPREGIHAVQIELARRLYMDETTLTPHPGEFDRVHHGCLELVERLGNVEL